MVGSSILIIYDDTPPVRASAWMIDFAKTTRVPEGMSLDHRSLWELGNHEDGYLTGLDNLIDVGHTPHIKRLMMANGAVWRPFNSLSLSDS